MWESGGASGLAISRSPSGRAASRRSMTVCSASVLADGTHTSVDAPLAARTGVVSGISETSAMGKDDIVVHDLIVVGPGMVPGAAPGCHSAGCASRRDDY